MSYPPEVAGAASCGEASRVRLFIANVEYANRNSRGRLAMVAAIDSDIVLLTEPGAKWQAELASLARESVTATWRPSQTR